MTDHRDLALEALADSEAALVELIAEVASEGEVYRQLAARLLRELVLERGRFVQAQARIAALMDCSVPERWDPTE